MGKRNDTRDRIVDAAMNAMRRQGFSETAISDLVVEAPAPRGSITFHFPGGKDEIAREAIALRRTQLLAEIDFVAQEASSSAEFVATSIDRIAEEFAASEYVAGCPVAPTVIERGAQSSEIRVLAADFFLQWRHSLEGHFVVFGTDAARAGSLATLTVSAIEGALVISRAEKSTEALIAVRDELHALLAAASPTMS